MATGASWAVASYAGTCAVGTGAVGTTAVGTTAVASGSATVAAGAVTKAAGLARAVVARLAVAACLALGAGWCDHLPAGPSSHSEPGRPASLSPNGRRTRRGARNSRRRS